MEVRNDSAEGKALWYLSRVEKIEAEKGLVHLRVQWQNEFDESDNSLKVLDRDSEEICPHPTHQKANEATRRAMMPGPGMRHGRQGLSGAAN